MANQYVASNQYKRHTPKAQRSEHEHSSPRVKVFQFAVAAPVRPPSDILPTDKTQGTKQHFASSDMLEDFPRWRFLLSIIFWLSVWCWIGCYSQNCCNVSPPGTPLKMAEGGMYSVNSARYDSNNGYCECAALGERCGCLGLMKYSDDKEKNPKKELQNCVATCCEQGECIGRDKSLQHRPWTSPSDTYVFTSGTHDQGQKLSEKQRTRKTRADYKASEDDYFPTCTIVDVEAPSDELKTPDCNCCEERAGAASICSNNLVIGGIVLMVVGWVVLIGYEAYLFSSGFGLAYLLDETVQDTELEAFTSKLCAALPSFVFTNKCSHFGGDNETIVTHTARKTWVPRSLHRLQSTELSGLPLKAHRNIGYQGPILAIPWRDIHGCSHITTSGGVVEVRVPIPKVSFACEELDSEFSVAFEAFKNLESNKQDKDQDNYVVVMIDGNPSWLCPNPENGLMYGKKVFKLQGSRNGCNPWEIVPWLLVILGFGWIHQIWYKSMAAVVVLPLHKSIGEEGRTYPQTNQTFNTILGMVVPREVHVTNSRLASRLDRTL
mmetsp:Transcript_41689/g.77168  ORF Transcript_41689/g.77168 Transcript_41689/m.77168 type:complete len:549 (-) Transcript_41689:191-1837(-)